MPRDVVDSADAFRALQRQRKGFGHVLHEDRLEQRPAVARKKYLAPRSDIWQEIRMPAAQRVNGEHAGAHDVCRTDNGGREAVATVGLERERVQRDLVHEIDPRRLAPGMFLRGRDAPQRRVDAGGAAVDIVPYAPVQRFDDDLERSLARHTVHHCIHVHAVKELAERLRIVLVGPDEFDALRRTEPVLRSTREYGHGMPTFGDLAGDVMADPPCAADDKDLHIISLPVVFLMPDSPSRDLNSSCADNYRVAGEKCH